MTTANKKMHNTISGTAPVHADTGLARGGGSKRWKCGELLYIMDSPMFVPILTISNWNFK